VGHNDHIISQKPYREHVKGADSFPFSKHGKEEYLRKDSS